VWRRARVGCRGGSGALKRTLQGAAGAAGGGRGLFDAVECGQGAVYHGIADRADAAVRVGCASAHRIRRVEARVAPGEGWMSRR
jgi:hypothetical protein